MPTAWERDLETARAGLTRWLRGKLPIATELEVSGLVAPQSSGFSNETLLLDLAWTEAGRHRTASLVARIAPTGFAVFPEYDLRLQFECMRLLAPAGVPVPRVYWLESEDESVFGAKFYVMGRVDGRVASPPSCERASIPWQRDIRSYRRTDTCAEGIAPVVQAVNGSEISMKGVARCVQRLFLVTPA